MGWSGGGLFAELIWIVQKEVPEDDCRREIYEHMIDSFRELDWDTLDECLGVDSVYDEIFAEIYPEPDEEEPHEDEE